MKAKRIAAGVIALGISTAGTVLAETQISTFESRIVAVPPADGTTTTYAYKIYGPNKSEYMLEGPAGEITKLAEVVRTNPNTVVTFEGDAVEGPTRVFHLRKWANHTETATDALGNKTTTTTRTETTEHN